MNELRIKQIAIGRLRPNKPKAHVHSKEQIQQMAGTISAFAVNSTVCTGSSEPIFEGHTRLAVTKRLCLHRGYRGKSLGV